MTLSPSTLTPREELWARIAVLGDDEIRVLARIAERLVMGAAAYGSFQLRSDSRDFVNEAHQEALDLAVYLAAHLERGR